MIGTSSTGTRVAAEASESGAEPEAGREGVEAGRAAVEGQEAEDATGGDTMDVDQPGQVLTRVCIIV